MAKADKNGTGGAVIKTFIQRREDPWESLTGSASIKLTKEWKRYSTKLELGGDAENAGLVFHVGQR